MWQVIESTATFVQGIIYFWFLSRLLDSKYDRRTTNIGILVTAVIYMLADMYSSEIFGRYSKAAFYVVILLYVFFNFKNIFKGSVVFLFLPNNIFIIYPYF